MLLSGGRYKKEVLVDGQSHLLLIREESGSPDAQVCVCVCVFVSDANVLMCLQQHVSLCSSAVLQLGGCSYPGLQPGERGQLPGALSALQPAELPACRCPRHRRRHPGSADSGFCLDRVVVVLSVLQHLQLNSQMCLVCFVGLV